MRYSINCRDTEHAQQWMDVPDTRIVETGPQDSGRCAFLVDTDHPSEFEAALDADDDVLEYSTVEVDE